MPKTWKRWCLHEEIILEARIMDGTRYALIASELDRTLLAIHTHARDMGLRRPRVRMHAWLELFLLPLPHAEVARRMGTSKHTSRVMKNRLKRLGLLPEHCVPARP